MDRYEIPWDEALAAGRKVGADFVLIDATSGPSYDWGNYQTQIVVDVATGKVMARLDSHGLNYLASGINAASRTLYAYPGGLWLAMGGRGDLP